MAGTVFPAIIKASYDPSGGFPKMVEDARRASSDIRREFDRNFNEIGQLARQALSMPRNAGGSLDLGVEEYKRAADAARAHATALREIATAAASAARENQDSSRATQLYVQAARAAATEAEREARSLFQTASAHEKLQAELNKTKSATDAIVQSTKRGTDAFGLHGESLRGSRQAMVQTGQQLQDLAISLYSGQRASTVFAQQLPQLAFALTSLEGSANKTASRIGAFAALLSGPLGSVALVAASVGLGVLVEKLTSSGKAADDASKAHETLAQKLDLQRNSYEDVIKATREYNAEQEKSRELTLSAAQAVAIQAKANIDAAIAIRQKLAAELVASNQTALNSAGQGFGGITSSSLGRSGVIENRIRANSAELAELTKAAENAVVNVATEMAKINTDPRYKIETRFDALRASASASIKDVSTLTARLSELNRQEKAALDNLKESNRGSSTRGAQGVLTDFLNPVSGGRITSTPGLRKDPVHGRTASHGGLDIAVPIGTPVKAPAGGVIIESGTLGGYGKVVYIDHGAGTITRLAHLSQQTVSKGDRVSAGQVVGLSGNTGKSTGPHLHYEVRRNNKIVDPRTGAFPTDEAAAEARNTAAERFQTQLEQISLLSQRIAGEFDDQPRLIDRANLAAEKLRIVIADINQQLSEEGLNDGQRKALEDARKEAEAAQQAIENGRTKPLREALKVSEEQAAIDDLIIQGREVEAEILSRILAIQKQQGPLTDKQAEDVAAIVVQERLRSFELEKQRQLQQQQLDIVNQTQDNVRTTIRELLDGKGFGAIGNFLKRGFDTYLNGLADQFAESLFGDVFRQQRMKILGLDKVDEAGREMAREINQAARALDILREAAMGAANGLGGVAANDNLPLRAESFVKSLISKNQGIVVNGRKTLSNQDVFRDTIKTLSTKVFGEKFTSSIGKALGPIMQGVALGQASSGILKSLGLKQSKLGSQIGGAIGSAVGGPIGAVIGGALGGTIGGLFKKTPRGSTTISSVDGNLGFSGTGKLRDSVLGLGGGVQSGIANIIESLGGTAGAFSVSIGQRGKNFVVDTSGRGKTKGAGVQKFKSEADAVRAAILDAINDGAVQGIRAGAQRLLQAGQDLDKALQKAVKFQSVFDRLDAIKDPIGSAIRTLNREFSGLISIFKEAGSSAEEFAQLEELYGLERAKIIKETTEQMSGALKQLLDDLKTGENGLDLRTRLSNALAVYNPLAETIRSGGTVDADAFAEAARTVLDLQRQIDGSQGGYFSRFNEVIGLSETALARQQAIINTATGTASPFTTTVPSNDNVPVVGAINSQTSQLLAALNAINSNIGALNYATLPQFDGSAAFRLDGQTYF